MAPAVTDQYGAVSTTHPPAARVRFVSTARPSRDSGVAVAARYVAQMIRKSLLPLTLALVALSTAPAEAKRFRTYVSCGISDSSFRTPPSHSCPVGDLP